MVKKDKILVSVCVITYNSAKTVIETLDSIYNQTYRNIELIISDDCSKDDTVTICRQWIEEHKERFQRAELVTVEKNRGVSANFNRSEKACRGEWIKGIAGDDLLLPNAIQEYVNYIIDHPDVVYVFANGKCFGANEEYTRRIAQEFTMDFFKWDKQEQLEYLYLCGSPIFAPSAFYNRQKCIESNFLNDERIPNYEDRPKWIRLIEQDIPFAYINATLICYRVSDSSISNTIGGSKVFNRSIALFDKYYRIPYIERAGYSYYAFRHKLVNKKQLTGSIIWKIICKILDIFLGKTPEWTKGFNVKFCFWVQQ